MERSVAVAMAFFSVDVILGGVLFAGFLILAFTQFKRWPILSFGILWFFIGLAPTSNILVPINNMLYEHWLYFPLVGIYLIVFWLMIIVARKFHCEKIFLGIFILFFIFLSYLTINRNRDWRNPIVFYNQILQYAPNSYRVINNLGMEYAEITDYQNAEIMYKRAIDIDLDSPVAYHNLANVYKNTGKKDLAEQYYQNAIKTDPRFIYSYNALADMYLKDGRPQEARGVLESYLKYDTKTNTLILLAQIAITEKNFKEALNYLEKALIIDPQNQVIQAAIDRLLFFEH